MTSFCKTTWSASDGKTPTQVHAQDGDDLLPPTAATQNQSGSRPYWPAAATGWSPKSRGTTRHHLSQTRTLSNNLGPVATAQIFLPPQSSQENVDFPIFGFPKNLPKGAFLTKLIVFGLQSRLWARRRSQTVSGVVPIDSPLNFNEKQHVPNCIFLKLHDCIKFWRNFFEKKSGNYHNFHAGINRFPQLGLVAEIEQICNPGKIGEMRFLTVFNRNTALAASVWFGLASERFISIREHISTEFISVFFELWILLFSKTVPKGQFSLKIDTGCVKNNRNTAVAVSVGFGLAWDRFLSVRQRMSTDFIHFFELWILLF